MCSGQVVYVHCGGGVSRSATIVIAFIMKKYRISYIDALRRVYKKRKVFPNDGFEEQLKLYEQMQWFTDGFNEQYRRFLLKTLTYQLSTDGVPIKSSDKGFGNSRMRFDYETDCVRNYFEKIANAEQMAQSYRNLEIIDKGLPYYCYYCRTELFNQINIICGDRCHLFIEPLQSYCTQSEGVKNGYLKCPNCLIHFGTYNWLLYPAYCTSYEKYKECLALRVSLSKLWPSLPS